MYTEDYIKRMLLMISAVLVQVLGLKSAGQFEEAHQAAEDSLESLLGMRSHLITSLDDLTLLRALSNQDVLDNELTRAAADLLREDALLLAEMGQADEAAALFRTALFLYLEDFLSRGGQGPCPPDGTIDELVKQVPTRSLSDTALFSVFQYYEMTGRYILALKSIEELDDRSGNSQESGIEIYDYCLRMLEKDGDALLSVGLDRNSLTEKIAELEERIRR